MSERATSGSVDAAAAGPKRPRLDSVDRLRGIVMVVMVLDHVRDFFSDPKIDAMNLAATTVPLYFTRWATHFCAPVFVFLAGAGAYLAGARGKPKKELSLFLFTRGLWLIFLEVTVIRAGIAFGWTPRFVFVQVIWAIGCSMIVLAGLIWLPLAVIAGFGGVMIAGHNLLDVYKANDLAPHWRPLWIILHELGQFEYLPGCNFFCAYPLIPWVGVMAVGYAFGRLLEVEPARRRRVLLGLGMSLTALFVLIRLGNGYGEPKHWAVQPRGPIWTLMSFLDCSKYPPSLLYLLMTLGPAIVLLSFLERGLGPLDKAILTFGRVPLFFYLLQWPIAHGLALAIAPFSGQPWQWLLGNGPFAAPTGYGYPLPFVYLMWFVALLLLYPPCAWFAALKRRSQSKWLSYF